RIGGLVNRIGTAPLIAGGMAAFVAGYALFTRLDPSPPDARVILPTMLLIGVGFALAFPSANMAATDGVEAHEQGLASGLVQTSVPVGGAPVVCGLTSVR